jgi:hypothetical protein
MYECCAHDDYQPYTQFFYGNIDEVRSTKALKASMVRFPSLPFQTTSCYFFFFRRIAKISAVC